MSLLLAEGHTAARRYPIAMVWNEAKMVRRRKNHRLAHEMVVLNATVGAVIAGPKHFKEVLKDLEDG